MSEPPQRHMEHLAPSSGRKRRSPSRKVGRTIQSETETGRGGLDSILGFHIRLAHGAVYRHFTETFSLLDLTQKQVSVLWLVDNEPGIAQIDLAQRLQMDRATTMAIVNRLQARRYLVRGKSSHDQRRQTLHLTSEGQDALANARAAILEHEAWLKSRFTPREVERLTEFLTRIHG
jgi:DNA-binding MarR family transcriptional regulator